MRCIGESKSQIVLRDYIKDHASSPFAPTAQELIVLFSATDPLPRWGKEAFFLILPCSDMNFKPQFLLAPLGAKGR